MTQPLVSIVIPTFNRVDLIGETLDSIMNQSYENWECIIVDDGSSDATDVLLGEYVKKEPRFQCYKRPPSKPKGANACRNIGLDTAKGIYIVFFDSDDLMTPNHIEVKVKGMHTYDVDYVITKTKYFNAPLGIKEHPYRFHLHELTVVNYLTQRINWLTLDICVKANVIKDIRFNEVLKSGQEYNFYSKLVVKSTKAQFIEEEVSLRRHHSGSIQSKLRQDNSKNIGSFLSKWNTYKEISSELDKPTKRGLLYRCIKNVFTAKKVPEDNTWEMIVAVFKAYGFQGFNFVFMLFLLKLNRGYYFRNKLKALSK